MSHSDQMINELIALKTKVNILQSEAFQNSDEIFEEMVLLKKKLFEGTILKNYFATILELSKRFCSSYSKFIRIIEDFERENDFRFMTDFSSNPFLIEFNFVETVRSFEKTLVKEFINQAAPIIQEVKIKTKTMESHVDQTKDWASKLLDPEADQTHFSKIEEIKRKLAAMFSSNVYNYLSTGLQTFLERACRKISNKQDEKKEKDESQDLFKEQVVTFFETYQQPFKRDNSLVEYFIKCNLIEVFQIYEIVLVLDVALFKPELRNSHSNY